MALPHDLPRRIHPGTIGLDGQRSHRSRIVPRTSQRNCTGASVEFGCFPNAAATTVLNRTKMQGSGVRCGILRFDCSSVCRERA